MAQDDSKGLTCPNCASAVPVPEGARVVRCPSCDQRSLVLGDRGTRRWQVAHKVDRAQALAAVKQFFGGIKKALDLKEKAEVQEIFLVYLPYWQVTAFTAGWMLGRVKAGDDKTKPIEVEVMEDMAWTDAAADVSEFGVQRVAVGKQDLAPYQEDALRREGMIFEPSESRTEAMAEAEEHFWHRARQKKSLAKKFFEKFHLLRPRLSIVYYPLWVARYHYHNRNYQVVVDGVRGKVLYGKAPGNILYRAAALVGGMAIGNLLMVQGASLACQLMAYSDGDDDSFALIFLPIIVGIALIIAAYRAFRYGEEVEQIDKEAKKAATGSTGGKSIVSNLGELGKVAGELLERTR